MLISEKNKKVLMWSALGVVIVIGPWLGWHYGWQGGNNLPEEFIEAREEGAFVAEQIVFLAHQSLAGLEQIGGLDEVGNYAKALDRVQVEINRNKEARGKALILSSHLGEMAVYLEEIRPSRAQAIATEAVAHEVNLVNHLLKFHGLLNTLFELLEDKFEGKAGGKDGEVKEIIADINKEIKTINNLNLKFNELMERFDGIYELDK